MDEIIFNNNILLVQDIVRVRIVEDRCDILNIYITFENKNKVNLLFKWIDRICDNYNINLCYILEDPKININGNNIDYSLYCLINHSRNEFIKRGYCSSNIKQNYDIYNKDLVYSVGEEDYENLKIISQQICNKIILDIYLFLSEKIEVKNKNLILSLNFNMILKDGIKNKKCSDSISKFLKKNDITIHKYIKLL